MNLDAGGLLKIGIQCSHTLWSRTDQLTDKDPYLPLSTQQTIDFLAQYDADHACNFPIFDTEFETMLTDNQEVHVSEPLPCLASTTKCSVQVCNFPKRTKAVEKAMLNL